MGPILTKIWIFPLAPFYKDGCDSNTSSKPLFSALNMFDISLVKHELGSMETLIECTVALVLVTPTVDREDLLWRRPYPLWRTRHVGTTVNPRFESPQCIGVDVASCV